MSAAPRRRCSISFHQKSCYSPGKLQTQPSKGEFPKTGQAVWPATQRLRGDPCILYGASHGTVLGADYDPRHKFDPVPNKKGFFDWRVTSPVAAAVGKHSNSALKPRACLQTQVEAKNLVGK